MSTFPDTQRSLVEALRSDDPVVRERALDLAARVYREPVIVVAMYRWSLQRADAEDLAHDFLAQAFEKGWLFRYDEHRGRFRTFLRACLTAFAGSRAEAAERLKRGGGATHVSIDDVDVAADEPELDAMFEREWARSVLATSIEALRMDCNACNRATTFAVFVAHDIDGADGAETPTYAALAQQFNLPVTQVTNYLSWARRRFRSHVLETLRALTVSDAEFRAEARALLGVDIG